MRRYHIAVLICISMMTGDVEHFFIYLLIVCLLWEMSSQILWPFLKIFLFVFKILFIFREREREGGREGEKHQSAASHICSNQGPNLQLSHIP